MIFDWYRIESLDWFLGLNIPSVTLTRELEGLGLKTVTLTSGNVVGLLYEGTYLMIEFEGRNPYEFDGHAVFVDDNRDIWLGIGHES
jgi:hypothetical protein